MISDAIFCLRTFTPLRSVLIAFQPELQSMAASFHGSANIRCVSSPSGGLSSRRAYLSVAALFGFHGRSNIYYVISFGSCSTVLGYLRSSPVFEVSGNTRTPAQKSPPRWSLSPTPSHPFSLFCYEGANAFQQTVQQFSGAVESQILSSFFFFLKKKKYYCFKYVTPPSFF